MWAWVWIRLHDICHLHPTLWLTAESVCGTIYERLYCVVLQDLCNIVMHWVTGNNGEKIKHREVLERNNNV